MALSINTSVSSMIANLNAKKSEELLDESIKNLSSASNANIDGASLSISNQLSSQVSGLGQAIQNSNESIGMLQIADGGMSGISDNTQRIKTLTLQASNGTLNNSNREAIQTEIDSLMESSNQIANSTSYNGTQLLNGSSGVLTTQTGANSGETQSLSIGDASVSSLIGSIDVTSEEGRDAALQSLDSALKSIDSIRSEIGSTQNALMSNIRNISVTQINTAAAESQISDVDFGQESANFSKANIMSQAGSFAQSHANVSSANLASLLG